MPMPVACNPPRKGIDIWHVAFIAALGGPFLGGCTEKPDSRVLPSPPVAAADKMPQQVPRPASPPPVRISAPRAVTRPDKPERKLARLAPDSLVGLTPPAIGQLLGKPAETREDAMMIQWTYTMQNCSLNVFFYPDIATGSFRALKYNIASVKDRSGHGHDCTNYLIMARSDESG